MKRVVRSVSGQRVGRDQPFGQALCLDGNLEPGQDGYDRDSRLRNVGIAVEISRTTHRETKT